MWPVLCARSTRKFIRKKYMKRTNGVQAAYDAILLHVLQADFGYAAIFNTLKEAGPWPSSVLCWRRLASFAEAL